MIEMDQRDADLLRDFKDELTITVIARENLSRDGSWARIEDMIQRGLMSSRFSGSVGVMRIETTVPGRLALSKWNRDAPKRALAREMELRDQAKRRRGYEDEAMF